MNKRRTRQVVAYNNLPRRAPIKTTAIVILLADRFAWPVTVIAVALTALWVYYFYDIYTTSEQHIEIFNDDEPSNTTR